MDYYKAIFLLRMQLVYLRKENYRISLIKHCPCISTAHSPTVNEIITALG